MKAAGQFHIDEVLPSYWRVTFDNGPVNLLDPDTIEQLGALVGRIETDPDLTVVVFRSDKPGLLHGPLGLPGRRRPRGGDAARPDGPAPVPGQLRAAEQGADGDDLADPGGRTRGAATLPEDDEFAPGLQAYFATVGRPENQPFAQLLFQKGLQQPDGIETHLGTAIGKLRQTGASA